MKLSLKIIMSNLCLLMTMLMMISCEHRVLEDPVNAHYIRIYFDQNIKNVTCGFYNENLEKPHYEVPRAVRVVLAHPESGSVIAERYLQEQGTDENGYYIHGYISAQPGEYNLLVYSLGSPHTLIQNINDYYRMMAYTNPVSDQYTKYMPIINKTKATEGISQQPDHLFHEVMEPVILNRTTKIDTIYNADGDFFKAHSLVKSYYIQVKVNGIEWASSAMSVLEGMAKTSILHRHDGILESEPTNILFSMKRGDCEQSTSNGNGNKSAILYTTFHTFGKLPDYPNKLNVIFEFMKRDGTSQVEEIDITDMFATTMVREHQWILIEKEIELDPPEGGVPGGMTPGVDDWTDVESEIHL